MLSRLRLSSALWCRAVWQKFTCLSEKLTASIFRLRVILITACLLIVSCLAYSSTPKMEAQRSSETSVRVYRATRRHISEDNICNSHRCENLESTIQILPLNPSDLLCPSLYYIQSLEFNYIRRKYLTLYGWNTSVCTFHDKKYYARDWAMFCHEQVQWGGWNKGGRVHW
jgi:hypothetical protein